jgi:peptide-methionine (R)-S-oxide reductase
MNRRTFIKLAAGGVCGMAAVRLLPSGNATATDGVETSAVHKIHKGDAQWVRELSPTQYHVLREEGTERPFSSPQNGEKRAGLFACAGCGLPLFPSRYKYDSGTGWPSFFDVLPAHVETRADYRLIVPRTEYHCARCGGHQGHVFDDGPAPTGLRYCNNGVALTFIPRET